MIKRSSYSAKVYRLKPQNPRSIRFRVHDHLQPHGQARAWAPHPVLDYKHDIRQITKKRVKSTVTLLYCLSIHHNNSSKLTLNIINCGLTYPLPLKWTIWLFVAWAPHPVLDYKHDIRQITKKRVKSTVTLLYCLSIHHNNSSKLTLNIINCGLTYPLPLKWTIWLFVVVKSIPNSIFSEHHKN